MPQAKDGGWSQGSWSRSWGLWNPLPESMREREDPHLAGMPPVWPQWQRLGCDPLRTSFSVGRKLLWVCQLSKATSSSCWFWSAKSRGLWESHWDWLPQNSPYKLRFPEYWRSEDQRFMWKNESHFIFTIALEGRHWWYPVWPGKPRLTHQLVKFS